MISVNSFLVYYHIFKFNKGHFRLVEDYPVKNPLYIKFIYVKINYYVHEYTISIILIL